MKFKLNSFIFISLTVLIFSSLGIKVLEGMNIIEGLEDSAEAAVDPDDLIADPALEVKKKVVEWIMEQQKMEMITILLVLQQWRR